MQFHCLLILFAFSYFTASCFSGSVAQAVMILNPPKNVTAALGTNATFSCRASGGHIIWEVANRQISRLSDQQLAAQEKIYAPLPTTNYSELIMTATLGNNVSDTRMIECIVGPLSGVGETASSELVRLLVVAEPHPPSYLVIEVDGLNLVATWTEPFSLEGEEISYVISVTNLGNGVSEELAINVTRYILANPIGLRDCSEYEITVFSRNNYSRSDTGVSGMKYIPTEPLMMKSADIQVSVSLGVSGSVRVEVTFNSADPCPSYPVSSYIFNITKRDTNTLTSSIRHTSTLPLVVDGSNGLVPDQVYRLVIEAENSVGSTLSEEILIYTTGLQSVSAVMELNRSITVTCSFATGASSTGCQVTILKVDSLPGREESLLIKNIKRQNSLKDEQVVENLSVDQGELTEGSTLLVRVADLLGDGSISRPLFDTRVVINAPTASVSVQTSKSKVPLTIGLATALLISLVMVIAITSIVIVVCIVHSAKKHPSEEQDQSVEMDGNASRDTVETSTSCVYATPSEEYSGDLELHSACTDSNSTYERIVTVLL